MGDRSPRIVSADDRRPRPQPRLDPGRRAHRAGWRPPSCCWPCSWWWRWSPAWSPTRWPCCPTPGTCSPTSSGWAWRWPPSSWPAGAPTDGTATFGLYRLEILAALANAVLLFGVALYVLVEARRPLRRPARRAWPARCWWSPSSGSLANLVAFALLRAGAKESLNVEGAYLEVLADTVGLGRRHRGRDRDRGHRLGLGRPRRRRRPSALWILPRTWRLGAQAVRILVQAAPPGIDLDAIEAGLAGIDGRRRRPRPARLDAHLGDGRGLGPPDGPQSGTDTHAVLDQARSLLRDRHRIDHATLQIEPDTHTGCDEVAW